MTIGGAPITASKKGGGKYILHVLQQKKQWGVRTTHTRTRFHSPPPFFSTLDQPVRNQQLFYVPDPPCQKIQSRNSAKWWRSADPD